MQECTFSLTPIFPYNDRIGDSLHIRGNTGEDSVHMQENTGWRKRCSKQIKGLRDVTCVSMEGYNHPQDIWGLTLVFM